MRYWSFTNFFQRIKNSHRKIPSQSLRLKGQRWYNQRDYTSLAKTPFDKKQLVRSGHFNRFSGSASNQRKKTKGCNKVPGRATVCHVTKSFTESQEKNENDIRMKSEKPINKLNRTVAKLNPLTFVRREIKTQEDKKNNDLLRTQRPDVEQMKSRLRVMSAETDDCRLVNEIKASIEAVKTEINSREVDVEKSRDAFDKSSELTNSSSNPRKPEDLMEELCNQRHFKVKPTVINVYNAVGNTEVDHPESVEGIPWNLFREEKFRLRSFVQYPLTAAKSAMLLAEDGFVYTGKGEERDDAVTCYFCCLQKLGWQTRDIVSDIHREMSPNCSMLTKINCDNVPIRSSQNYGQNFDTLLNQLNSTCSNESGQHTLKTNADTHGNVSRSSGDIDADCENDTRQRDSIFNQPTPTRGNPSENGELNSKEIRRGTVIPNTSTFQHTVTTQGSTATTAATTPETTTETTTATSRKMQTNSPNLAVQTTRSSASGARNVASVPSSPQITLPHVSTEPRNTGANNVSNSSTNTGQPSLTPAGQPSVEVAGATSASSNSTTVSQTTANNGEKKNGKGPTYAELGIITERPKRPEYAVKETRLKTFENWPPSHHLKPEDLADAGFYFAGYGDCARCFYCGGGLRNWEDEDDVWVEHARWFPKCAYIRQQMGQVFVDTVQELNKTLDVISFATVKERCKAPATASSLDAKLEPLKRDPAVLTVVDFGYSLTDVLQVAKIIKGKDVILSSDVLLTKLQELEKPRVSKTPSTPMLGATSSTLTQDQEAIRQIKEKNNQLRQQTVCKICMDKEVAVVFLPCGHLVSCAECASAMKDCPVCRVTVKGIVRAFI